MRSLIALVLLAAACGSARHVVVHPDEVAGRKGDDWHVTREPAARAAGEVAPAP